MTDQEAKEVMDGLFPVGKERWVKVKYLNQDKCKKVFRWSSEGEEFNDSGYVVTALSLRDEYQPQVSALMDLSDEVCGHLLRMLDTDEVKEVQRLFRNKIEELKQRIIIESPQPKADAH